MTILIYSKNNVNALGHSFNHSEMKWTNISNYQIIKKVSMTHMENFISILLFVLISIIALIIIASTATEKNITLFMILSALPVSCPLIYRLLKFQRVESDLQSVKEIINEKIIQR